MAIEIDEPTILETVLHYGLLLGAAFQLVCIFAVIFVPRNESEQEQTTDEMRPEAASSLQPQPGQSNKKPKKEKKKYR